MKSQSGQDSFWPYDSIDEIYSEKVMPEFGIVPSKWRFSLPSWRFFHAENRDMVPLDFNEPSCSDKSWDAVEIPSVWQQEGYGLPVNLLYDAGTKEEGSKLKKRLQSKFIALANSESEDDVAVYRTRISLPASYSDRAVYFSCSGIRGRFELFVNGSFASSSGAIYSTQKFLISPFLQPEDNLLTLLIYHLDSDRHGRVKRENGTFGYSGIFRMPEIIAESYVEISDITLKPTWDPLRSAGRLVNPATENDPNKLPPEKDGLEPFSSREPGSRRNAALRVQISLQNHLDLIVPVRVECELIEARNEYDLYHLPVHPVYIPDPVSGNVPRGGTLTLDTEIFTEQVLPWSDMSPNLYDLILTVLDAQERVICVKKRRFGFRTIEVLARIFHINDAALPLRAVRYFTFDPVGGLSVSADRFRQDICLMKQANLNAVLTAHFPCDPMFYYLCDHYGIYIISQADKAHVRAMIESLMTHPSIAFWSFSPLHFDESKLWELKQKLLLLDSSRPFYSEKDRALSVSDIPPFPCEAGTIFGEWSDICVDRRVLQSKHGPGHSIFETLHGRAKRDNDSSDFQWLHQGDFEEFHEKMDVPIAQGIVGADRRPHPVYYEIKRQCETLQLVASAENLQDISLVNMHPLGETKDLILSWQILMGGHRVRGGRGYIQSIPPLGKQEIRFPFDVSEYLTPDWMLATPFLLRLYDMSQNHELILDIRVCLAEKNLCADKGHEVAFYQQILIEKVAGYSQKAGSDSFLPVDLLTKDISLTREPSFSRSLIIKTRPEAITAAHSSMIIDFSRKSGGLCSILCGGHQVLAGSMRPSFFRAATNSDRSDQSFVLAATVFSKETDWRTIQQDLTYQRFHYEMNGEDFSMLVHYKSFAFKREVMAQYIMSSNGKLTVTLSFTPRYDLLRSGFRVIIQSEMNKLSWYGRGLHEAYPDRKESARIGYYEATPQQLHHEYARPQENGAHCDTQYLLLSNNDGKGIKITSGNNEKFSFTASVYSPEDIDDYQHQDELRDKDSYELFLDFYQRDIERTGQQNRHFIRNQTYQGSFVFEPWEAVLLDSSDRESP